MSVSSYFYSQTIQTVTVASSHTTTFPTVAP